MHPGGSVIIVEAPPTGSAGFLYVEMWLMNAADTLQAASRLLLFCVFVLCFGGAALEAALEAAWEAARGITLDKPKN